MPEAKTVNLVLSEEELKGLSLLTSLGVGMVTFPERQELVPLSLYCKARDMDAEYLIALGHRILDAYIDNFGAKETGNPS